MDPELNPGQVTQDPLSLAPEGQAPPAPPAPSPAPTLRQISEQDYQEFENLRQRWQQAEPALQEYQRMRPVFQQLQEQRRVAQQEQEVLDLAQKWQATRGMDPETARGAAEDALGMVRQYSTRAQEAQQAVMEERARGMAIRQIASQYGVSPADLENCADPPSAVEKAQWLKERSEIRAQLKALSGARVPPQKFESGMGTGGGEQTVFTREQIENMSIEDYMRHRPAIERAYLAERIRK